MIDVDDPIWALMKDADGDGDGSPGCIHCGSNDVRLVDGNVECMGCHTIVNRFIDAGPEWRHFAAEGGVDPSRCGPPVNDMLQRTGDVHLIGSCFVGGGGNARMRVVQRM
jgi:hypothetical protein